jgi:hypothetical protein
MLRHDARMCAHVFLAATLVALLSGTLIPTTAHAQDAPPSIVGYKSRCSNVDTNDYWGEIGLPNFGTGAETVQSYTVDAWNKNRLFVTNGTEVFRTMDGGCSWTAVYKLPSQPTPENDYSALDSRINQVVIPEGTTADTIVYFVLDQFRPPSQDPIAGTRTRVFRSENNGSRWVEADGEIPSTLPPHGRPELLVPSPSFPKVLYLLLESPATQYLATSPDGGETWGTEGPVCVAPGAPTEIDLPNGQKVEDLPGAGCIDPDRQTANAPKSGDTAGIALDPFHPNDLWYYGPRGLERSQNNGEAPEPVEGVDSPIGEVDVFRVAGDPARVIATSSNSQTMYVSGDGGATWRAEVTPGIVESIAKGRVATEYAMATDRGVFISFNGTQVGVSAPAFHITDIQSARTLGGTGGLCFFGSLGQTIGVTCLPKYDPDPCPDYLIQVDPKCRKKIDVDIDDLHLQYSKAARFVPEDYVAELKRGTSEEVPYSLELYKSPTPLDVYFLIDISGSMQNTIDGVATGMQRIINELAANKINTQFGLGVYRAYDDAPAYKRLVDIGMPGDELERAFENLIANGGGSGETQLAALYQTATGEGQHSTIPLDRLQADIEAGQQANFRDEALKVVIHAADEAFSTLPPHPSFDQAITALNEKDIEQVGLAIQEAEDGGSAEDPEQLQVSPRGGLLRVAQGTKTLAAGDVDCNGKGGPDIHAGQPLVCDVDPDRAYRSALMSGAIVQLLESVEDIGEVQVTVDAPPGVVPNMPSKLFTGVDFKHPEALGFEVMFACPSNTKQKEFEVKFNAIAREFVIARSTATVRCIDPVKPEPPIRPDIPDDPEDEPVSFFPPIAFVPPVVRPPEITPNPGPSTQTQTQAQQQAQLQNAMAKQKQEQVQLALAYSKGMKAELAAERAGDQLNMSKYRSTSARRQEDMPPGLLLMMTASAMSLAFGLASRKFKTQIRPARRNRRSHY